MHFKGVRTKILLSNLVFRNKRAYNYKNTSLPKTISKNLPYVLFPWAYHNISLLDSKFNAHVYCSAKCTKLLFVKVMYKQNYHKNYTQ